MSLKEAFSDLLAFGVVREVGEAEYPSLAWQGEFGVEGRPGDLVAEFHAGENDVIGVQLVEDGLEGGFGERRIGKDKGRPPHMAGKTVGWYGRESALGG